MLLSLEQIDWLWSGQITKDQPKDGLNFVILPTPVFDYDISLLRFSGAAWTAGHFCTLPYLQGQAMSCKHLFGSYFLTIPNHPKKIILVYVLWIMYVFLRYTVYSLVFFISNKLDLTRHNANSMLISILKISKYNVKYFHYCFLAHRVCNYLHLVVVICQAIFICEILWLMLNFSS